MYGVPGAINEAYEASVSGGAGSLIHTQLSSRKWRRLSFRTSLRWHRLAIQLSQSTVLGRPFPREGSGLLLHLAVVCADQFEARTCSGTVTWCRTQRLVYLPWEDEEFKFICFIFVQAIILPL